MSLVNLQQTVGPDAIKQQNKLYNAGIKETMRILGSKETFQAAIFTKYRVIPKPAITYDVYSWVPFLQSLPYATPRTVGLRRMKPSDVPKALALTNQYTLHSLKLDRSSKVKRILTLVLKSTTR